jgi:histidinol-phosphate phosphatase family protein
MTVFLDRDGVLNENVGYLSDIARIVPTGIGKAIALAVNASNLKYAVITNQPIVATGEATLGQIEALTREVLRINGFLKFHEAPIYICPHLPTSRKGEFVSELIFDCTCRKPKPGLIVKAIIDLGIDPMEILFIGDSKVDVEAGLAARVKVLHIHLTPSELCDRNVNLLCMEREAVLTTLKEFSLEYIALMFKGA